MSRSALWASTHPAYDIVNGGYVCECGTRSPRMGDHLKHVVEAHPEDQALASATLSSQQMRKWEAAREKRK